MSKDADYHRTFGSGRAREERVDELTRKARLMPQHVKRGFDQRLDALRARVKSYEAYLYLGDPENMNTIHVHVRPDQDFWQYATDWERTFSTLCWSSSGQATPVVNEQLTVIGHLGVFGANSIFVCKGAPEDIERAFESGQPAFVRTVAAPLSHYRTLDDWGKFDARAYVAPDGAVRRIWSAGYRSDAVEPSSISPIDIWALGKLGLVVTRVAFTSVRGGARYFIKSIEFKGRPRGVGAGPTKELAEQAAREASRKVTGGATTVTRELAAPSDLRFAKGTPLPKPDKPDTVYRIMSNDEAAKTLANKKLPPPIRRAEGERFVSLNSNYPAQFREKPLADLQKKMHPQVEADVRAMESIKKRIAELKDPKRVPEPNDPKRVAELDARLEKLKAEHEQRGIANKAEADAVIKQWHAMEGQQVVVEIELKPGTLDGMLRRSVDYTKWDPYRRSGKDVFMWKFERGYGLNIGIPKWQLEAFNKSIVKVRLHAYKQPLGKAGLPKPSRYGPN